MSQQNNYNSLSPDAMFAKILLKLEEQDRSAVAYRSEAKERDLQMIAEAKKTNGRVTKLENKDIYRTGFAAAVALGASAAWHWITNKS